MNLRKENKRLRQEHEKILKSLCNRQNQHAPDPIIENREKTPTTNNREDNVESIEGHKEEEEGNSDNVSDQRRTKRQRKKW